MKIKIYGSRGSMPFFSRKNIRYGGNTSCYKIETEEHNLIIDCGSGLKQLCDDINHPFQADILLSHLHLDHIIGLCSFSPLWSAENKIRIYTKSRSKHPLSSQVFGIFKPPYWPVDIEKLNKAQLIPIAEEAFKLSEALAVTPFIAEHADATTSFRIDAVEASQSKSVVYLLDYEIEAGTNRLDDLILFCKDADVIIFDASYMPEDSQLRRGWGHSCYESGMLLAERSGCKRMVFTHFDQAYSDKRLDGIGEGIGESEIVYYTAFDGMELEL